MQQAMDRYKLLGGTQDYALYNRILRFLQQAGGE